MRRADLLATNGNRNEAVSLLQHYFGLAMDRPLTNDGRAEVAAIADSIIAAAIEVMRAEDAQRSKEAAK